MLTIWPNLRYGEIVRPISIYIRIAKSFLLDAPQTVIIVSQAGFRLTMFYVGDLVLDTGKYLNNLMK
jgi:hypothetical protein